MDRLVILKELKKLYSSSASEGISYAELHEKLEKEIKDMPTIVEFSRALTDLGFRTVSTGRGMFIVMEQPKVTFKRVLYLQRIRKARSLSKNIYYIGVRTYSVESSTSHDEDKNMFFYYAISRNQPKIGFFCLGNEFSPENYVKWLHVLIPLLEPSSVVVVNKGSFKEHKTFKKISRYNTKKEMISWLKRNDVPCNPLMHKAELYELIEKCSIQSKDDGTSVDSILKAYGHEVLRLPDAHPELDPKIPLWQEINMEMMRRYGKTNNFKKDLIINMQKFILERKECIEEKKWNEYEDSIIASENEYFALDMEFEKIFESGKYSIANPLSMSDN